MVNVPRLALVVAAVVARLLVLMKIVSGTRILMLALLVAQLVLRDALIVSEMNTFILHLQILHKREGKTRNAIRKEPSYYFFCH